MVHHAYLQCLCRPGLYTKVLAQQQCTSSSSCISMMLRQVSCGCLRKLGFGNKALEWLQGQHHHLQPCEVLDWYA